jgi:hypothetical protein
MVEEVPEIQEERTEVVPEFRRERTFDFLEE